MRSRVCRFVPAIVAALASVSMASSASAQSTHAFTYQGTLMDNGAPANGTYDFYARLYPTTLAVSPVGPPVCVNNVQVVDGLFTIALDFGDVNDFISERFLSLAVRPDTGLDCTSTSGYVTLAPFQRLTPAPFATIAKRATYLGSAQASDYARTDIAETFAGAVTFTNNISILDNANIVGSFLSSSSLGCRFAFESSSSARAWTIGATGSSAVEGGDRFSIWDVTSNVPGLVIEGVTGYVGLGTSNPAYLLDLRDGRFRVATTAAGSGNVFALVTGNEHGLFGVINSSGNYYVYAGESQASGAANVGGQLLVNDINGSARGGFQILSNGNCTMFAQVKSFMVPNPDDAKTDIYYACVEGPEAAMYVRGTGQLVDGQAVVTLPRHFTAMALAEGITVQITPLSADCNGIAVVKKGTASFAVKELMRGTSNAEFDWEVKAVRAGYEDFEVIRPRGIMDPPKPDDAPAN